MEQTFREKLGMLLNYESLENASDTPDFILADYMTDCLNAFGKATRRRAVWYEHPEDQRGDERVDA